MREGAVAEKEVVVDQEEREVENGGQLEKDLEEEGEREEMGRMVGRWEEEEEKEEKEEEKESHPFGLSSTQC